MFPLPRRHAIEEDELLLSYALRNRQNSYEGFSEFCNHFFLPGEYKNGDITPDEINSLENIKKNYLYKMEIYLGGIAAQEKKSVPNLFLEHSMFALDFPLLLGANQGKIICDLFRSFPTEICPPSNSPLQSLRYCPECVRRDLETMGMFVLYRSHQIPFIHCCPEHGCCLKELTDPLDTDFSREPKEMEAIPDTSESFAFSRFCNDFLRQETCLEDLCRGMFNTLSPRGYTSKPGGAKLYEEARNWIGNATQKQLASLINSLTSPTYTNKELLIRLSWYCSENNLPVKIPEYNLSNGSWLEKLEPDWKLMSGNTYLATIQNQEDKETLYVSPYQVSHGWPLPEKKGTLTDIAQKIISGVTHEEYELVGNFINADSPVKTRHKTCGKITEWKFRTFIYEGVRCPCESQITYEEAKANIEASGEFELVEFKGANFPVSIRHLDDTCLQTFEVTYHKFLERPWCKVCNPRTRDGETLRKQVMDLVGDEYIVLGDYIDSHTPVLMKHNIASCQREFMIAPSHFLEGGRCLKCSGLVRYDDFCNLVEHLSGGQYKLGEKVSDLLFEIHNTQTGEIRRLTQAMILQELKRTTPSKILPLQFLNIDESAGAVSQPISSNVSNLIREYILNNFTRNELIFLEDIPDHTEINGILVAFPYERIKSVFGKLVKNGILDRISSGLYCFSGASFSNREIIEAKYILRRGDRIGYITGASFASLLGLCNKPPILQIATNKESMTHGRTVKCLNENIKIKGPVATVTNENFQVLALLDILQFGKKYLKDKSDNKQIGLFIKEKNLRIDDFSAYLPLYPSYTRGILNKIFKEEVWNE